MTGEWSLPSQTIDFTKSTPAGTYNVLLGGRAGYAPDRAAAKKVLAVAPDAGRVARENFMFAGRAAGWAAARFGIRQVADIGVGIVDTDITNPRGGRPAMPSVEDCVRRVAPGARVLAFDLDPVVLAHARSGRSYRRVLYGDVTDLDTIFDNPEGGALELADPMIVILAAVLAGLLRRLAAGSVVVLSHATTTATEARRVTGMTKAYDSATSPIHFRAEGEIGALVDGWELADPPGLCNVARWGLPNPHDGQAGEHVRVVGLVAVRLHDRPDGRPDDRGPGGGR